MQSFDTDNPDDTTAMAQPIVVGNVEDLQPGTRMAVELPEGRELALFNIDGEFYAVDNFCPHKGAPLSEGTLCERVVECEWHGWQFDLRTGECLTVTETIKTFEVIVEDGVVKVTV